MKAPTDMCKTVCTTVTCTLQMISRVILTILLAVEDLIRLVVCTAHAYVSTCFQCFSFMPVCLAYYCVKQYYCASACNTGRYPTHYSSCGCTLVIVIILLLVVIFFYTYWLENLLENFDINIPCSLFRRETFSNKIYKGFKTRSLLVDTIGSYKTASRINANSSSTDPEDFDVNDIVSIDSNITSRNKHIENFYLYPGTIETSVINYTFSNETNEVVSSTRPKVLVKNLAGSSSMLQNSNRSTPWSSIETILSTDRPPMKLLPTDLEHDSQVIT